MNNISKIIEELSILKGYIPILINRVEFYLYDGVTNLSINPYFTHSENKIFINSDYIYGLNDKEVKFLLLLNLMINNDINDKVLNNKINSIEVINYYTKLISLDDEVMLHLIVPREYQIELYYKFFDNPFKSTAIEKEKISELSLFTSDIIDLSYQEDDIKGNIRIKKLDFKHIDELRNDIHPDMKEYHNDLLFICWKKLNTSSMFFLLLYYVNRFTEISNLYIKGHNNMSFRERDIDGDENNFTVNIKLLYHPTLKSVAINLFSNLMSLKPNTEGKVTYKLVKSEKLDKQTIEIKSNFETPHIKIIQKKLDRLSFKIIDKIEDAINFPNQNLILQHNIDVLYRIEL